jgi:phage terminase large subunit
MSKEITIQASRIFEENYNATERFVVNIGGTRSTKTYSLLQVLIVKCLEAVEPLTISVVRKSFPSLKISAMRDFYDIIKSMGLYSEENHSKQNNTYLLNNCLVEFLSIDDSEKKKGSKRDILYINECNELEWADFSALNLRTALSVYLDFNPSELFWFQDKLQHRKDVKVIHSTYLDNPFLTDTQIKEIEMLKETDEQYWQVYGLGQYAGNRKLIYQYQVCDNIPTSAKMLALGCDFGFSNDPTALIEAHVEGVDLYLNELIYERNLTNNDLAAVMNHIGIDRYTDIICDSAEPKSIEELRRLGFNTKPVVKGADSVNNGIDILKRYRIHVTKESVNLINEFNRYKWVEDKNGVMLNKPIDAFNHALDAVRYIALMKLSETKRNTGKYNISVASGRSTYNLGVV